MILVYARKKAYTGVISICSRVNIATSKPVSRFDIRTGSCWSAPRKLDGSITRIMAEAFASSSHMYWLRRK